MPTRPTLVGRERRVYALVASLPYSGAQTAFFSLDMTIESFLEGHARAFEWLGGVPRECVYDNLRSVVARREGERSSGISASCTCAATTPSTRPPARRRRRARRARSRRRCATSRPASGRRAASPSWASSTASTPTGATRSATGAATRAAASRSSERLAEERRALRPLPPARFDWSAAPHDAGADRRLPAPRRLLLPGARAARARSGSSCASTATRSGSCHRGHEVARYPRSYEHGRLAAAADHAPRAARGARRR